MNILLLTDRLPFPPRNGMELPTQKLFSHLATTCVVSVLVVNTDEKEYQQRLKDVPDNIHDTQFIQGNKMSFVKRFVCEVTGNRPAFAHLTFDHNEIHNYLSDKYFDLIWVSPINVISFILAIKRRKIDCFKHLALGMNDVMTAVHRQSLLKFMKRGTLELPLFIKYLRTPLIKRFERRYYQEASFIHLQTSSERDEAYRMLGRSYAVHFEKVHVAPNGIDASFIKLEYEGYDSNILLFMTSLEGSRAKEGQWFLKKIWPMVRERTDLTLYLVGSKPNGLTNLNDDRIVLKGFVEDLPQMCAQSAIGILPIFHKSGIINRLNDMLSVGMPVICTSAPASTLPDLINGKHVLIADNALDFADKIVQLYGNIELREKMSQDAKQFMKTRPTWNDFVNKLSNGLMNLSKAGDK